MLFAGLAWQRNPPSFVALGKAQVKKKDKKAKGNVGRHCAAGGDLEK